MTRWRLGCVRNGSGAPREHPKRPGGASGASKTVWGHLESIQNGPLAPRKRPKRSGVASGVFETA